MYVCLPQPGTRAEGNAEIDLFFRDMISARGCLDVEIGYPVKDMACSSARVRTDVESAHSVFSYNLQVIL